ncbi:hypothetical protein Hanom_Chr09g00792371 [Helianthus anomalus]
MLGHDRDVVIIKDKLRSHTIRFRLMCSYTCRTTFFFFCFLVSLSNNCIC